MSGVFLHHLPTLSVITVILVCVCKPQHARGGQRTTCRSQFSPSARWSSGVSLRLGGRSLSWLSRVSLSARRFQITSPHLELMDLRELGRLALPAGAADLGCCFLEQRALCPMSQLPSSLSRHYPRFFLLLSFCFVLICFLRRCLALLKYTSLCLVDIP